MLTSSGGGGGRSMLTGGDKICQNLADVICERSLTLDKIDHLQRVPIDFTEKNIFR